MQIVSGIVLRKKLSEENNVGGGSSACRIKKNQEKDADLLSPCEEVKVGGRSEGGARRGINPKKIS